jgi:diadenosine tetraphosphate (Ap4A) HIT family hydrolase
MVPFALDPRLEQDSLVLGRLALSRVLLMDDSRFPWLILVPERAGVTELLQLDRQDRHQLMDEIVVAQGVLSTLFGPDKLNLGALGNLVPQLHVHVVARFVSDAAWPGPVWGAGPRVPYPPHQAGVLLHRLSEALRPAGLEALP